MTKTKHSLLMSAIALLLCFSMLIGTTFAWFTDTVTSSGNIIKSGTLDVTLSYLTAKEDPTSATADWKEINEAPEPDGKGEPIFNYTLWEPGYTEVRHIKIENEGSLALKYIINFIPKDEQGKAITNLDLLKVDGVSLADVIDVYYIDPADKSIQDREDLNDLQRLGTLSEVLQNLSKTANGTLLKGEKDVVTLALKMQETAGNEYQNKKIGASFDIQLFATQLNSEKDSIDENYDSAAMWTGEVNTDWYFANVDATEFTIKSAEELAGLAAIVNGTLASSYSLRTTAIKDDFKGKTIYLGADIDLNDIEWTPIGDCEENVFMGNFDGKNHTVSNLNVTTYGWAGLIGHAGKSSGSDIKNVTVKNATINANRLVGAVVGQLYGSIDNCHVENVNIMVVPNAVGDKYDNGDKVGGIVGWLGDNGNNRTLTNCTAKDVILGAYRDVGGIAGYVAWSTTIKNNSVKNIEITVDQITYHYGDKDVNAGAIWGRNSVSDSEVGIIAEGNTSENVSIESTYSKDGITYKNNGVTGETTLYLVPSDYESTTVTVPEGVTTLGNYSFSSNSNVKTVKLSSTVKTLGRAFDSSTVEKVVLNEGLEKIDSRAFRSTANLKEVIISSTVKEISDNAFQKSGIKTITIPATVDTIGETAFGASLIETVIFEGSTSVQGYAFRGCPNLRKVYLMGDDVTFIPSTLNGRNSMWFCNGESNNPNTSDITFYVVNETVEARVKTAMGAEADNTDVIIIGEDSEFVEDADSLIETLENGNGVVLTSDVKIDPAGMSNAYGTTGINVKNGQTIDGGGNVLDIKGAGGTWDSGINTTGGLIKNITVTGSFRGIFINHNSEHSEKVVLENVIIDGTTYTISCDQGTNQGLEATNSTFKGWTSYAETLGNAKFVDCYFGEGNGYSYCRPYAPTEFVDCEFEEGFRVDPRAEVTFENCTLDGVAITSENVSDLVTSIDKVTVK